MSQQSLADFLEQLQSTGELKRIAAEVDPNLEIAEITRRVAAAGGPALLFERVRGHSLAVVTNLLGTKERVCRALELETLDQIVSRAQSLVAQNTPQNWFERLRMSAPETGADRFRPRPVKTGPVQQIVRLGRDVDLQLLPLVKLWKQETAAGLFGGRLVSSNSHQDSRGVSWCDLHAVDASHAVIQAPPDSPFARHWAHCKEAGEKLPLAIFFGGDPVCSVASSLDASDTIDGFQLAGLLRGRSLDLVKCRTHEVEVPAEADLVLEGYVDPHEADSGDAPVLHVTAITHRSHPIVPIVVESGALATQAGERAALAAARERLTLDALKSFAPDVVDLALPQFGAPGRFAFVSFQKRFPHHARQVASAVWAAASLSATRYLVLVDADVNVHDAQQVLSAIGENAGPKQDVIGYDGPVSIEDAWASGSTLGRHLAFDATRKVQGERSGPALERFAAGAEIEQLVTARWSEYKLDD